MTTVAEEWRRPADRGAARATESPGSVSVDFQPPILYRSPKHVSFILRVVLVLLLVDVRSLLPLFVKWSVCVLFLLLRS